MKYIAKQDTHYKNQIKDCVKYFLRNQGNWIEFGSDYNTIQIISYLINLKILNYTNSNIAKINPFNANLYLNNN